MTKPKGHNVAYIRVSSLDQNTGRQLAGLLFDRTFTEKASAKDTKRPQLQECIEYIRSGDTLHVHSIDRLARNLKDLQELIDTINGKGAAVKFHKESLEFSGDDNPFQKLQLQMMGAFAEFERALIRERQREGIVLAKKAGKQIGAKRKLLPEQIEDLKHRVAMGESKKALAEEYGIARQTLYNAL